jgi:F0F1-type ATP synthase epsilon subunit
MNSGKSDLPKTLHVIARSPFEVHYEGEAQAVSAANRVGDFDILPGHADFFSVLEPGDVQITTDKSPITFSITNGIITARDNEVMLFVNM